MRQQDRTGMAKVRGHRQVLESMRASAYGKRSFTYSPTTHRPYIIFTILESLGVL
jgi:hypothetical protein